MDILELSESPCSGVGICCTSTGLGRQMVKELDLKPWEWLGGEKWSPHLIRDHREGSPSLRVWLFLTQSVTAPVRHSSDGKQRK